MQFKFFNFIFRFNWLSTLILLAVMLTCYRLGMWQYSKAVLKQQIEAEYQASALQGAVALEAHLNDALALLYQKVRVTGEYDTRYQILIDNQVENSQAGYHVVTPFKIADTAQVVLVNRGWVAGYSDRARLPSIDTPSGKVTLEGMVWEPTHKIFTLESAAEQAKWQTVWQHLDMQKYQKMAPMSILPVIVKLDEKSDAGGFVRHWEMPPSRIATHLSYAYQWFGFAFAAFCIYIFVNTKRLRPATPKT